MESKEWLQVEINVMVKAVSDFLKYAPQEKKKCAGEKFAQVQEALFQKGYTRTLKEIKEKHSSFLKKRLAEYEEEKARNQGSSGTSPVGQKIDEKLLMSPLSQKIDKKLSMSPLSQKTDTPPSTSHLNQKSDLKSSTSPLNQKTDLKPSTSPLNQKTDMKPSTSPLNQKTDLKPSTSPLNKKTDLKPPTSHLNKKTVMKALTSTLNQKTVMKHPTSPLNKKTVMKPLKSHLNQKSGKKPSTSPLNQKIDIKSSTCIQFKNGRKINPSSVVKNLKRDNKLKNSGRSLKESEERDQASKGITINRELDTKTNSDNDSPVQKICSTNEIRITSNNIKQTHLTEPMQNEDPSHITHKDENTGSSDIKEDVEPDTRNTKKNKTSKRDSKKGIIPSATNKSITKEGIKKPDLKLTLSTVPEEKDISFLPENSPGKNSNEKSSLEENTNTETALAVPGPGNPPNKKRVLKRASTETKKCDKSAEGDGKSQSDANQPLVSKRRRTVSADANMVTMNNPDNKLPDGTAKEARATRSSARNIKPAINSSSTPCIEVPNEIVCTTEHTDKNKNTIITKAIVGVNKDYANSEEIITENSLSSSNATLLDKSDGTTEKDNRKEEAKTKSPVKHDKTKKDTTHPMNCNEKKLLKRMCTNNSNTEVPSKLICTNNRVDQNLFMSGSSSLEQSNLSKCNEKPADNIHPPLSENQGSRCKKRNSNSTDDNICQNSKLPPVGDENEHSKQNKARKTSKKQKQLLETSKISENLEENRIETPLIREESLKKEETPVLSENPQGRESKEIKMNTPKEKKVKRSKVTLNVNEVSSSVPSVIELKKETKEIESNSSDCTALVGTTEISTSKDVSSNRRHRRQSSCDENLDSGAKAKEKTLKDCFCKESVCFCNFSTQSSIETASFNRKNTRRKSGNATHQIQSNRTSKIKTQAGVKLQYQDKPKSGDMSTVSPKPVTTNEPEIPGILDPSLPLPRKLPVKPDPNYRKPMTDQRRAYLRDRRKKWSKFGKLKKKWKNEDFWQNRNQSQNKNTEFSSYEPHQSWKLEGKTESYYQSNYIEKQRLNISPKQEYHTEPMKLPRFAAPQKTVKRIRVRDFAKEIRKTDPDSLEEVPLTKEEFMKSRMLEPVVTDHLDPGKSDILPNTDTAQTNNGAFDQSSTKVYLHRKHRYMRDYYAADDMTNSTGDQNHIEDEEICVKDMKLLKVPQSPPCCNVQEVRQLVNNYFACSPATFESEGQNPLSDPSTVVPVASSSRSHIPLSADNKSSITEDAQLRRKLSESPSPALIVQQDVFLPVPNEINENTNGETGLDVTTLYRNPSPPLSPNSVFPPSPANYGSVSSSPRNEISARLALDSEVKDKSMEESEKSASSEQEKHQKGVGLKGKRNRKIGRSAGTSKVLFALVKRMGKVEKDVLTLRKTEKQILRNEKLRLEREEQIMKDLRLLVARSNTQSD